MPRNTVLRVAAPVLLAAGVMLVAVGGPAGARTGGHHTRCQKVSYTGNGGYYSAQHFYPEPSDRVTIATNWCFRDGIITSHSVSVTTSITSAQHPYLHKSVELTDGGRLLTISVNGNYSSDVLRNGGVISINGTVTGDGRHRFTDVTGQEG